MKIKIVVVGKTRQAQLADLMADYEKRISHFCRIGTVVVRPEEHGPAASIKEREGTRMMEAVAPEDYLVALDSGGEEMSSERLAQFLSHHLDHSSADLAFLIGGPYGLADGVKQNARKILSLSRLTFNHDMVRLFLLEQLYRCFAIRHHLPYHK